MSLYDDINYLEYDDEEIGARRGRPRGFEPGGRGYAWGGGRASRGRLPPGPGERRAQQVRDWERADQGLPGAQGVIFPLGFTPVEFTVSSGTALQLRATPQRELVGQRMVFVVARNGASATGLLTLTSLMVGAVSILASGDPIPIEAFGPTAVGTSLLLPKVAPGLDITANISVSLAPTTTDTIDVSAVLMGPSIVG